MSLLLKRRFAPKFVQNKGSRVQKAYFLLTCVAQKRRCLRLSRKWWQKMELNLPWRLFPTPFCLFIPCVAPSSKLRACVTCDGAIISMEQTPFLSLQTFLGVRHAFLPYTCRVGTRDANVCVDRLPHFLKRSEGIQLRSPSPIIANISHLRSCFDSWACPNHIFRPHKLIWVSALTFLMCWFHYSVEILVTVRSNIYYSSHS